MAIDIPSRIVSRIVLFGLILLIIPMVIFPERFGTELLKASLLNFIFEFVIYGVLVFMLNKEFGLPQLVKAASLCLAYRLTLGLAFSLLISVMYAMNLHVSLTLGISSYLPSLILHALATPFVLHPIISRFEKSSSANNRRMRSTQANSVGTDSGLTNMAVSKNKGFVSEGAAKPVEPLAGQQIGTKRAVDSSPVASSSIENGFERATRYIGEDGAVYFVGVVDHEGLLMANFTRRDAVADDWAPLAPVLLENNGMVLSRGKLGVPLKADLTLDELRVVVARDGKYYLMVVAERQTDDLLNVRINQGLEIVRKYVEERYPASQSINPESVHVSGT